MRCSKEPGWQRRLQKPLRHRGREGAPPPWTGGRGDPGTLQVLNSSDSKSLRRVGPPTSRPRAVPRGRPTPTSVAQGLAALQHAAEDDLHAGRGAQPADPAVLVLALDVAGLVLVPARAAAGLLQGGDLNFL